MTISQKFEQFYRMFEPKSIEMAVQHFLYKPTRLTYNPCSKEGKQMVHLVFSDQSHIILKEKIY